MYNNVFLYDLKNRSPIAVLTKLRPKVTPFLGCQSRKPTLWVPLDVVDEASEESARPGQTVLLPQARLLLLLVHLLLGQLWGTLAHLLGGNGRRWLNPNGGIPFARRQHGYRIKELVHAG